MKHNNILTLFQKHKIRQKGLQACMALIQLTELLQQHRGITLATQAGNLYFKTRQPFKQQEINESLDKLKSQHSRLIPNELFEEIDTEWKNILQNWPKEEAFNNFLIQSHFIHRIQLAINHLVSETGNDSVNGLHQRLVEITLKILPLMAETIAQSRGLAVYLSTTHQNDPEFISRLKFLIKAIGEHQNQLLTELKSLDLQAQHCNDLKASQIGAEKSLKDDSLFLIRHLIGRDCIGAIPDYLALLEDLTNDITHPTITPDHIFSQASHIIREINHGITRVSRALQYSADPDLSSWISLGQLTHA